MPTAAELDAATVYNTEVEAKRALAKAVLTIDLSEQTIDLAGPYRYKHG